MDYKIFLYIIFGILPSLAWLFYYLRKDAHPEPKWMVIKIFLWGALITIPTFFIQIGLKYLLNLVSVNFASQSVDILLTARVSDLATAGIFVVLCYWFFIIAFSEEFLKYIITKIKILKNPALDEPVDIMIYMIISAIGFAAIENTLYLFSPVGNFAFNDIVNRTLVIVIVRFLGATFLHTLCSAVAGYYLAIAICYNKNKKRIIFWGVFLATLLHGLYDFSIMTLSGPLKMFIPLAVLMTLSVMVFYGFENLKKLKSVCKI